jgi:hypothetical protein
MEKDPTQAPILLSPPSKIWIKSSKRRNEMSEWQSIETAPKDRKILILGKDYVSVGKWDSNEFAKNPKPHFKSERGYLHGKRWELDNQPTHWMPLPEPPKP